VLGLVLVRVPVPPPPVGPGTLGDARRTSGGFRLELFGLLDDRLPRRTLPSSRGLGGVTEEGSLTCTTPCRWPCAAGVGWGLVPVMRRSAPGVRLRALTLSGCPRMLQVALRACAPRTEQAALASVVCPLGCRGAVASFWWGASLAVRLLQSETGSRRKQYLRLQCPYRSPFPHDEQHRDHRHHPAGSGQRHR
jgi:hypothetical protein